MNVSQQKIIYGSEWHYLYPSERAAVDHCIGGLMDHRAVLEGAVKIDPSSQESLQASNPVYFMLYKSTTLYELCSSKCCVNWVYEFEIWTMYVF